MTPSWHGFDEPASRTDAIQRPLPVADGSASSGESPQTDDVIGASVTFSSFRIACAGRWKLAAYTTSDAMSSLYALATASRWLSVGGVSAAPESASLRAASRSVSASVRYCSACSR